MGTKRVQLSVTDMCEITTALKLVAAKYQEYAQARPTTGQATETNQWHNWATNCLDIATRLQEADTVELVTEEDWDDQFVDREPPAGAYIGSNQANGVPF